MSDSESEISDLQQTPPDINFFMNVSFHSDTGFGWSTGLKMHVTGQLFGKMFGELGPHVRGIVTYTLSPFEQKPFANCFSRGLPNIAVRTSQTVCRWLPTFIAGYLVFTSMEALHASMKRKNPADYLNETPPPEVTTFVPVEEPVLCSKEDTVPPDEKASKSIEKKGSSSKPTEEEKLKKEEEKKKKD